MACAMPVVPPITGLSGDLRSGGQRKIQQGTEYMRLVAVLAPVFKQLAVMIRKGGGVNSKAWQ